MTRQITEKSPQGIGLPAVIVDGTNPTRLDPLHIELFELLNKAMIDAQHAYNVHVELYNKTIKNMDDFLNHQATEKGVSLDDYCFNQDHHAFFLKSLPRSKGGLAPDHVEPTQPTQPTQDGQTILSAAEQRRQIRAAKEARFQAKRDARKSGKP
jgi:hypothetical protein